jgi:site-specific recombinase XerC
MSESGREQPEAATGGALKFGEWVALLSIGNADDSPAGVRDAAMVALFKIAGLRRAEMACLTWQIMIGSSRPCCAKQTQQDPGDPYRGCRRP